MKLSAMVFLMRGECLALSCVFSLMIPVHVLWIYRAQYSFLSFDLPFHSRQMVQCSQIGFMFLVH